ILRSYPGVFDTETAINTALISKKAAVAEAEIFNLLDKLNQKEIISYRSSGNDSLITFNEVREDELTINRVSKFLDRQNEIKTIQFDAMIHYITDNNTCKSRLILQYFNEESNNNCGICSYCISKNSPPKDMRKVALSIIELLKD